MAILPHPVYDARGALGPVKRYLFRSIAFRQHLENHRSAAQDVADAIAPGATRGIRYRAGGIVGANEANYRESGEGDGRCP